MNAPCADCRLYGCPDDGPDVANNRARRHCDCHGPVAPRFFEVRPSCPQNTGPGGPPIPHRSFQGRVFQAGSDEGYRRTGHRDAVIELPGPDGSHYYLTREYVLSLFDLVEGR